MALRYVALCCVLLLIAPPPLCARAQQTSKRESIKERLTRISGGSIVEVKFTGKHRPALQGRLGAITDTAFDVQHVKNDRVITDSVRYDEVKSIRTLSSDVGWSRGTKIIVGTLAGIGAVFTILIIVAITQNWG